MNQFTHLHVHSHYSILDGMSKINELVDKAVANGMYSLALTDHGAMFGIKEFCDYANKKNGKVRDEIKALKAEIQALTEQGGQQEIIAKVETKIKNCESHFFKPILGCETYVARRSRFDKSTKEDGSGYHLVLLAKNKKGYQNLCKLISAAWIDGYYYRPRIDKELLDKYSEGLIVSTACLGGEIPRKILSGDIAGAEESIMWFKERFGDDFYLELQRLKTETPNSDFNVYEKQQIVNVQLLELAQKTHTKVIATNDVHFVNQEHAEGHDRLICLSTGKDFNDPNRMHYTKQEWLKTPDEMAALFADIPEALSNTLEIADKVEAFSLDSDAMMPMFPIPESFGNEQTYRDRFPEEALRGEFGDRFDKLGGYDKVVRIKFEADYLRALTFEGAKERYGDPMPAETLERIEFELDVMKTMGFPGYFLIVQDFIQAARDMKVSVGPGRGSAAGSAVAYCLKITDIDPIRYDLLFERFLNPDRISMPDIDIDFDDDGRGDVLRWVTEKYGKEKVAHIITYGTMATKSSIKDVARVQNLPLSEANRLTKLVPDKLPDVDNKPVKVNMANCLKYVDEMREAASSSDQNLADTLKYAAMLEGTVRQTGVHACGVIIGSDDLTNFVPLSTAKEKGSDEDLLVTQYEGSVIENVGLIKMDFLGLKTLSIIKEALKNIKQSTGTDLDIATIPIDDLKTYELYSSGRTTGTFQFESAGMQKYLRDLKPTQFEDLIAMNALYRPGPMEYIPEFIDRKHGRKPIVYDIPVMERYLKDTYGITVYQEQVMLLSRLLANFTRGESDTLRKAMGKKLKDKMASLKVKFVDGCKKNGYEESVVLKIWEDWEKFASYAFNKSHATCYSWIAYQTAYLKANYPAEFMAANLTRNKDDIAEVSKFMDECKAMGIAVLGPDVNESRLTFVSNQKGEIRFGLGGIKGVGEGAVEAIVREREKNGQYTSIFNFMERVNLNACNRKAVESLVLAGAFDAFTNVKREQYFAPNGKDELVIDSLIRYGNKIQNDKANMSNSLFGGFEEVEISKPAIPPAPEWSALERLNKEREYVGIYLSAHPLDEYELELRYGCNTHMVDFKDIDELRGREIVTGGIITAFRNGMTKTGRPFGSITVEDYSGSHEFMLFGNDFVEYNKYMISNLFVCIWGSVKERGSDWKFKKERDPSEPVVWEFKIRKMDLLPNVKGTMINAVSISIDFNKLTDEFVTDLRALALDHSASGKTALYFNVMDEVTRSNVKLFARSKSIHVTKPLIHYLEEQVQEETLSFAVNR